MRYAFNGNIEIKNRLEFDVVIIGSGLAGLYTSLNIDSKHSCCIMTKEGLDISNSWLAQGGIAAAIALDDTPFFHLEDTLIAGAGLCDKEAVEVLVDEGPTDIRTLVSMNVPFDLNADGDLQITREGGHRRNRIVHAGGDATGRETVKALAELVYPLSNIKFMDHTFFVDILTDKDGAVSGMIYADKEDNLGIISTKNIVIATGGIGQVYLSSTNPSVATGDGIAAAVRAGAKLKNMEFIQFHPTGLYSKNAEDRAFLISEAVRGEGGLLKNSGGVRFMEGTHELNELAPRDIVARGIVRELKNSGEDHVFVDITEKGEDFLKNRFPTIYNECLSRGINIATDWIPVCPVQHYLIGGVEVDLNSETCVKGLYICGEAACTGVHGANRLASNSMLECLVFGRRAAAGINAALAENKALLQPEFEKNFVRPEADLDFTAIRNEIRHLMHDNCYVIRNEAGLKKTYSRISEILSALEASHSGCKAYIETLNIASIAKAILTAALDRKESVGAHYRED